MAWIELKPWSNCFEEGSERKLMKVAQRAMKLMSGYFGGYISKRQKMGQFELRKSIGALPLLKQKLEGRNLKSGSAQLAHVCNRMFTVLEGKGILRSSTEETLLASRYNPADPLAAEFIRTFRINLFCGAAFLAYYDALKRSKTIVEAATTIPKAAKSLNVVQEHMVYGCRPTDPRVWFLSPWEFIQHWGVHKLKPPGLHYTLTKWLTTEQQRKLANRPPIAHIDYGLNEAALAGKLHWIAYPVGNSKNSKEVRRQCLQLRNSVILFAKSRPEVPCPEQTPMPNRYMSKDKRSKIFSVYLRQGCPFYILLVFELIDKAPFIGG